MAALRKQCEASKSRGLLELGYFAYQAQQLKKPAAERPDFNKYYEEVRRLSDATIKELISSA